MQQVTLYPGQLVCDARHATIHHGPHFAQLSRLEYRLVIALLHQRERWQTAPGQLPLCLSVRYLRAISESASEKSTHNALNEAKQKVSTLGLQIIRIYGEDRYLVLFDCEVEGQPTPVDGQNG